MFEFRLVYTSLGISMGVCAYVSGYVDICGARAQPESS